jgi:hypothetical protein
VLVVGVVTGTYSTIYVAGSLVVDWTLYVEGRFRRSPGGRPGRAVTPPPRKKVVAKT